MWGVKERWEGERVWRRESMEEREYAGEMQDTRKDQALEACTDSRKLHRFSGTPHMPSKT